MLSPLGPAEQLHGGSSDISASSFWILFALALILLDMVSCMQRDVRYRVGGSQFQMRSGLRQITQGDGAME
jgi:hypothetical protein